MTTHFISGLHPRKLCSFGLLFLLVGCANTHRISIPVYAKPVAYVGIGGGGAHIDANVGDQGFDQIDSNSTATQVTAGLAMADHWGVELRFADLGDAEFDNDLKLGYQVADVSLLAKLPLAPKAKAFLRLGAGDLSSDGDFEVREQNDIHTVIGVGFEYDLSRHFGLRAEVSGHDIDAQHGQLSLIYRFNPRAINKKTAPVETIVESPQSIKAAPSDDTSKAVVKPIKPAITPVPTITPKPAKIERQTRPRVARPAIAATPKPDADGDNVVDASDLCPGTAANEIVNDAGCALFGAAVPGVLFADGSITLDDNSLAALDVVASRLIENPELQITVAAYSSQSGDAASDLLVSRRRTIAVLRYLRAKGIDAPRIRPDSSELVSDPDGDSFVNRIAIKRQ